MTFYSKLCLNVIKTFANEAILRSGFSYRQTNEQTNGFKLIRCFTMVAALPLNFRGDLKISNQNNWGGDLSKKLNLGGGGAKFKGGL